MVKVNILIEQRGIHWPFGMIIIYMKNWMKPSFFPTQCQQKPQFWVWKTGVGMELLISCIFFPFEGELWDKLKNQIFPWVVESTEKQRIQSIWWRCQVIDTHLEGIFVRKHKTGSSFFECWISECVYINHSNSIDSQVSSQCRNISKTHGTKWWALQPSNKGQFSDQAIRIARHQDFTHGLQARLGKNCISP